MSEVVKAQPVAPVNDTGGAGMLLNVIAQAASNPDFDLDRMERLFSMQRQVLADEAKKTFQEAMAACQAEMPSVVKDAENSHLKSKYARLEAIDDAVRPVYTRHGFSLMFSQRTTEQKDEIVIVCTVLHKGGHSVTEELPGKVDAGPGRSANQAIGSSITYLKRYLTCMIFNVVVRNEDRDGNAPGKDTRLITETQVQELDRLIKSSGVDLDKVLAAYGLSALSDMVRSDYPAAKRRLEASVQPRAQQ